MRNSNKLITILSKEKNVDKLDTVRLEIEMYKKRMIQYDR